VPQRTCVGCRQTLAKRGMIRIVRTPEGLRVDPTGKVPGRGAYLHDRRSCWEHGIKSALAHALKVELSVSDRELLSSIMQTLPEEVAAHIEPAAHIEMAAHIEPEALVEPNASETAPIPAEAQPGDERGKPGSLGNAT